MWLNANANTAVCKKYKGCKQEQMFVEAIGMISVYQHLEQFHHKDTRFEKVKNFWGFKVWKFSSVKSVFLISCINNIFFY